MHRHDDCVHDHTDLICLMCQSPLTHTDQQLRCPHCGTTYPIVRGVPRFVLSDAYVSSFSEEWARHSQTQVDSVSGKPISEQQFFARTGLLPADITGKRILDAGCGVGRYMEVCRKYGGIVTGVDMSFSVNQARDNTADRIIQADIMKLPFPPESFDIVFSLGVLHHTRNTELAFRALSRLVKPEGILAVWVYSNEGLMKVPNFTSGLYRRLTTRLPRTLLYRMCRVAVGPLYAVNCIPVVGVLSRALLPVSHEADREWRVLDTFDWYSPVYQHKHNYREVESWFQDAGFDHIRRNPVAIVAIAVSGRRS